MDFHSCTSLLDSNYSTQIPVANKASSVIFSVLSGRQFSISALRVEC